jgi:hypothetical protein
VDVNAKLIPELVDKTFEDDSKFKIYYWFFVVYC